MYSNKPRIRVFSVVRKMNQNHQQNQQMMRVPKQEMSSAGARRYVQQPPVRNHQPPNGAVRNGSNKVTSSVTIEEVPNHAFLDSINNQASAQPKFDEEKLPVFLIKLWNIVEDANLQSIVHWDESGVSFHIADPYSFCRNVLPHFFKHNNLNSLIRQLNMYGFRKMTPLSQGGLTRTESDQDHLEFSHPCFVQHRPELLSQIKRKQSTKVTEEKQVTEQTQQNLEVVMAEMRAMREKARNMETKMNSLTKENREMWEQMAAMRQQHGRQQTYFKKLIHFIISIMQPGLAKRVAKRGILEIEHNMPGSSKRPRTEEGQFKDVCDLLESLQRDTQETPLRRFSNNDCGPLISDVTDEFGNSPGGRSSNDMFSDAFATMSRYSDHSREQSPHPIISQPSSSNLASAASREDVPPFKESPPPPPQTHYMGSGALTHENVHRSGTAAKRDFQGVPTNVLPTPARQPAQKRVPYKTANRQFAPSPVPQYQNNYPVSATSQLPPQMPYSNNQLMRIEDHHDDPHQELYSPTLALSPSLDRQISQELQEYFTGYDTSLDNFRDLVHNSNWETFGENLPEDEDEEFQHPQQQHPPLALKNAPETSFGGNHFDDLDTADLLDPLLSDSQHPENGFEVPDPNYMPLADEEIFPHSPVLRTPSPSDLV